MSVSFRTSGSLLFPVLPAAVGLMLIAAIGAGILSSGHPSPHLSVEMPLDGGPSSGCTCATISNTSPIEIEFWATGEDISSIELWYRLSFDEGASWKYDWRFSGLSTDSTIGELDFDPIWGKGLYEFYTIAEEANGERESPPAEADCYTGYNPLLPGSFCWSPEYASSEPIPVDYVAYAPDGSSVATVTLFYRFESDGWSPWMPYSECGTGTQGTINFSLDGAVEDGLWEFYTAASDSMGRQENQAPEADAETLFDTVEPLSASTCDDRSQSAQLQVHFDASDESSGVETTRLYFRIDGGDYEYSGLSEPGTSGTLTFEASSEGVFDFYTEAHDRAGNVESYTGADCSCTYDETAPVSWCDSQEYASEGTVAVSFEATDAVSGVALIEVYTRYTEDCSGSGGFSDWELFLSTTTTVGAFPFHLGTDGTVEFKTIATDHNSNTEAKQEADAATTWDLTPPTSSCTSVACTSSGTTDIDYASSDSCSGVSLVSLYARFGQGQWQKVDSASSPTGAFASSFDSGDGRYEFYTLAKDGFGWDESKSQADTITYLDTVAPTSQSSCDARATSAAIAVSYAADDDGCGVASARLYCRFDDGDWSYYGEESGGTGAFDFVATEGDGLYEFYTIALDEAGNEEAGKDQPDSSTLLDTTPPSSSCDAPEASSAGTIEITYTCSDETSGIDKVALYWRSSGDCGTAPSGEWQLDQYSDSGQAGAFSFSFTQGEGIYQFRTIALDKNGNVEQKGTHDAEVLFDPTPPVSSCDCPRYPATTSVLVVCEGEETCGHVASFAVRYRMDGQQWRDYDEWEATDSTLQFRFEMATEATYEILVEASDNMGNSESKAEADCITSFDLTAPISSCDVPEYSTEPTVEIAFTAADAVSGVRGTTLYWRFFTGDWEYLDEAEGATSGTFHFTAEQGEGAYEFMTISEDMTGNTEQKQEMSCSFYYGPASPNSTCWVDEDATSAESVDVHFSAHGSSLGIARVDLYARSSDDCDMAGGFTDYWLCGSAYDTTSGTFSFDWKTAGAAAVQFKTIAHDHNGESESKQSADDSVLFDFTAPQSVAFCDEFHRTNTMPISFSASDDCSGVSRVTLEYRYKLGNWYRYSGDYGEGQAGTIDFSVNKYAEGRFDFHTLAEDPAGNSEAGKTESEATAWYDATAPVSAASAPAYSNQTTFAVGFDSSDDEGSGVASTQLWARYAGHEWHNTGMSAEGETGSFNYGNATDGTLEFFTIASDRASNVEARKSVADSVTIIDTVDPESSCQSPHCGAEAPISVTFVTRDKGSGILRTRLYYQFNGGEWSEYGQYSEVSEGVFAFWPPDDQEGIYSFYTEAEDAAHNRESPPDYPPTTTFYDRTPPEVVPDCGEYASYPTINIPYTASDDLSGIASIHLWSRFGGSSWVDTGLTEAEPEGVFEFESSSGEGTYEFGLLGEDSCGNSGNVEDATCSILLDVTPPTSDSTSPEFSRSERIQVQYDSADSGSGIFNVALWFKTDEDMEYRDSGLSSVHSVGSFEFEAKYGEGRYRFVTAAKDRAGVQEKLIPAEDTATVYDASAPSSEAYSPASVELLPIPIDYSASDEMSGIARVYLHYRFSALSARSAGAWKYSGLSSEAAAGRFNFAPTEGQGTYEFCTLAEDAAGNVETYPAAADCSTRYELKKKIEMTLWVDSPSARPGDVVRLYGSLYAPAGVSDVDFYAAVQLPDGSLLYFDRLSPEMNPWITGLDMAVGTSVDDVLLFEHALDESIPPGDYQFLAAFLDHSTSALRSNVATADWHFSHTIGRDIVITLATSEAHYSVGDELELQLAAFNPGNDRTVDFYLAVLLPDFRLLFLPNLEASWEPYAAGLFVPAGLVYGPERLLKFEIAADVPPGTYRLLAACSKRGSSEAESNVAEAVFAIDDTGWR